MLAASLALLGSFVTPAGAAAQDGEPRITIVMLPSGTSVEELSAALPDAAPGVLSAGIGQTPASQTYLDITQGARLGDSLYDERVPPLYVTGDRVFPARWQEVLDRAEAAPADLRPGLLATTLQAAGVPVSAAPLAGSPALIGVNEQGQVRRTFGCGPGVCPGLSVTSLLINEMQNLGAEIRPGTDDLLIAIERPPADRDLLAIAIAGEGFTDAGNLTSPSTRMDGFVLSTDLLPTILDRYGLEIPDGVSGQIIDVEGGAPDPAAVTARESRLSEVPDRRSAVIAVNLLIWLCLTALAAAIWRRRGAQLASALLATAMAWAPALLLLTAALEPSSLAERLIVGIGAPLLSFLSLIALRGRFGERAPYAAFATAATVSIVLIAADVLAGSPYTSLSILGPKPAYGVRFFGIGNELESTIACLLTLGTGAAVAALKPPDWRRTLAIAITVATLAAVLVFAPGRFGADVGAAITFPAGAAAMVIAALRLGAKRAVLVLAAPVIALAALIAIDLALGGDAHLSRSVLDAGGLDELGDVLERRITLSAGSFTRYWDAPLFLASVAVLALGLVYRRRIAAWFTGSPPAGVGVIGAIVATVIGTLANDSGVLLFMMGTLFISAFCGLAWAAKAETPA